MPHGSRLPVGEVFAGRYELLDLIGEGGMGSVWRVHDRRENRVVAAKVLRQSDAVSLLRFVREQAVRVRHPHVVTPLGWAGEDDRVLFTMPVVEGGSVATLVGDHGPLPPLVVAELVRQLLGALGAVHEAGLVHRDVKPGNVLLAATGAGRPHSYLTDFGIAVDLNGPRLTQTGYWSGTPGYAAPESLRGADPAPSEDLYSAGLVGLALLIGKRPTPPVVRPAGVPDALWSVLTELVSDDPQRRPASAAEAAGRLEVPELSWDEKAMGGVEVLRQVGDVSPDDPAGVVVAQPAGTAAQQDEATTVRRPTRGARREAEVPARPALRQRRRIVPVAVAASAVVGVALWSVWPHEPGGAQVDPTPPPVSTFGPTGSPSSASEASPTTTSESRPTQTSSATGGTIRVGTVVVRVGQPCSFAEVGVRETTVGGEPVLCRRGVGGGYDWQRP